MKRIINFKEDETNYIIEEKDKQLLISKKDKILNGIDLYNNFFKTYNKEDEFEYIKNQSEDKMTIIMFDEVEKILKSIDEKLKEELKEEKI